MQLYYLLSLAVGRRIHNPYVARARAYGNILRLDCNAASPLNVSLHYIGLGYSPFARHYSGNLEIVLIATIPPQKWIRFLFLRVLRWFTSPRSRPAKPGTLHITE